VERYQSRTRYAPPVAQPTVRDVDALVGPATPHFAYQLRARVRELIQDLPADDRLASSKAENAPRESRERIGWETIPSSAPAYDPLPRDR
jgi:hypothetical protein